MGYKKCHGMKYQGVVIPNGLIGHLSGPFHAPQNNMGILVESNLLDYLESHAIQPGSTHADPLAHRYFQVYRDSAYGVSPVMVSPYAGIIPPTPEQQAWNTAMGGIRISVEHGFGVVLQDWLQLNCFWHQHIWGTHCGTAHHYSRDPPMLKEYFHAG
ncbi:hypothetical protein K439DRAFT_1645983 [Ramaria rubella]|nr:hypothetical protein K439DRAFT_1645983 [Ramaria rubella]